MIETFVEQYLKGQIGLSQIDDFVDQWHDSDDDRPIEEFLGLTLEEYAAWVEDPQSLGRLLPSPSKTENEMNRHRRQ